MRRKRIGVLAALAVCVLGLLAAAVYAATIEVVARGTIGSQGDKVNLVRGVARLVGEPTDAAVQHITLGPGEGPSWHTHPGPAIAIVKTGALTLVDDDCSETTFTAGEVFVDQGFGHVHRAFNPTSGTTEVWVTYVVPQGANLIIPNGPPECAA